MRGAPNACKWLEGAAVGVLVAGTAWLGSLVRHNGAEHGGGQAVGRVSAPSAVPAADAAGRPRPVDLAGRSRPVLLLVLSTECPFCAENMTAWKRLVSEWRTLPGEADVLALSIGTTQQTEAYLRDHGLDLEYRTVTPAVLPLIGATGYPTTAVYLPADRSLAVWPGMLREGDLAAVLALAPALHESLAAGAP